MSIDPPLPPLPPKWPTAQEHFAWSKARAMEQVDLGRPDDALALLVSHLNLHEGTAGLVTPLLAGLFYLEILRGGTAGARAFLEGLSFPDPSTVDGGAG